MKIDQATLALNTAIQNLKPVDGGSGDGNGEGNGNGSTGGNGNGSGSTGGSGNGSGNAGGNGSTGGSGTGNSAVQTGDSSNLFVYAGTLLLAAAAFVFGFRRRIRKIILMPKAFGQSEIKEINRDGKVMDYLRR